jgi:Ca-activated chloride channel family protein
MRSFVLAGLATLLAAPLAAQGWIEPLPGRPMSGVVKVRSAVSVRVTGRVAQVQVEEWFQNTGGGWGEGDYLYPLPGEAVFSNYSLFQGDKELKGETMDARQARAIYEEIVRRKKDPALIELAGHGLIRARVFPISPGETRRITLRYTELMPRVGDALQFRYAAGGRYGVATRIEGAQGPQRRAEPAPLTFRLVADSGAMFGEPFSPTHQLRVRHEDGRLIVEPDTQLAGDLSLFLPLAHGLVGMSVVTHRPNDEPGYFMLTVVPGQADAGAIARDITVVLDVSGSMSGSKLDQAKQALGQLLGSLHRADRFRLASFSSTVTTYRSGWTPATGDAVRDARRWVEDLQANGGTNIEQALQEAFRLPGDPDHLDVVLFLTDGLPSVGEQNPERLAQLAERSRGAARVFAFGVGYDVNTYLLDRLSAAGHGSTQYVTPGQDVEQQLGALTTKISHPVLTDLRIVHAPARLTQLYPEHLPDLFAGEELVVFGRYASAGRDDVGDADDRDSGNGVRPAANGRLVLEGRRAGRVERFEVQVAFPAHERANDYIPRLWAARKIGVLTQALKLNGRNSELEQEIKETALRYGLLTEYTSYLVQEPAQVALHPGIRLDEVVVTGAGAPAQASGQVAVAAAERARESRALKSVAALNAQEMEVTKRAHGPAMQTIAGRIFVLKDGVWTDLWHADSIAVVRIAPFSDAYFAALDRLPELVPYWKEMNRVLVSGRRVSIVLDEGGVTTMSAARLDRLARDFRGR